MQIKSTTIENTFAEAFGMKYVRLLVTAHDDHWLDAALKEFTGFSSSVIGCDLEIGVENRPPPAESPDGRPGATVLAFGFSKKALAEAVPNRTGQCLMTCPTTAVFNGMAEADESIPLGGKLRYFGDGFQKSKLVGNRRFWRIPVMEGEFLVEASVGVAKGVAGGNVIVQADKIEPALEAVRRGVDAVSLLPGVITPFPGGVARSGSKVGSQYKKLRASTADAYCPTLRGRVESKLDQRANVALEIVIDGVSADAVGQAMTNACLAAAGDGIVAISAGNYGGELGKHHFHLHDLLGDH